MSKEFDVSIEDVALAVLPEFMGAPNKHLCTATELRWGSNGSFSVDLKKNAWHDHEDQTGGGVLDLLRAFKGYEKPEALEWLEEQGFIERREKPNGRANGTANGQAQGKFAGFMEHHPVATYQYFDDKGRLAYEVLKFPKEAPRRYMQRRKHPDGSWIWKLQGGLFGKTRSGDWFTAKAGKHYDREEHIEEARRWLYRRDEVLKAKKDGKPVLLVEGEKDVETMREWGLTATTNAGGAKYWQDSFDDDLTGCDVLICGDNDDSSRQRTMLRGAGLHGKAKSVRVLDLALHWKDMPEKADVSDWKEQAGGTAEQFAKLMKAAPHWKPERPRSRFGAFTWDELDVQGYEQDYIVEGWWTEHGRSVIGGPSKSGKSFLAIHLAMCIARGIDYFGYPVTQGAVIYQAGEGGWGIKRRFKAYRKHFEVPADEDVPIVPMTAKIDLYDRNGDTQPFIDEVNAWKLTLTQPLRMIVIDTLSTATAGADENSGKDMGIVLANIAKIEEQCCVHVCLVHHMNAGGKKLRGHTSIYANVDQVVLVESDPETKIRTAVLDKQKDDEDGIKLTFTLASVAIGHNEKTGRDITSCVVLTVDEKEKLKKEGEKFGFSVRPSEEALLIPMFKAIKKYGKFVATEADGPAEAVGKHVVDFSYFLEVAVEMDSSADDKVAARVKIRKQFERNTRFLIKSGVIGFKRMGDKLAYVWWTGRPIRGFPETFPEHMRTETGPGHHRDGTGTKPEIAESPGLQEALETDDGMLL